MLHRLVSSPVLANTERVVSPDKLHWKSHQRRQAHRGLHVVAEHEERATCSHHSAVQGDSIHYRRHCQLCHTAVQECACEVVTLKRAGLLQECIGLVAIGQVGTRHYHVAHILGQCGQHVSARRTRCQIGLMRYARVIHRIHSAIQIEVELRGLLRIGFAPLIYLCVSLGHYRTQFIGSLGIQLGHLREYLERSLRIAAQVLYCLRETCARRAQRIAVSATLALKVGSVLCDTASAHHRVTDDNRGALGLGLGLVQCGRQRLRIRAVHLYHVPVPRTILRRSIFFGYGIAVG